MKIDLGYTNESPLGGPIATAGVETEGGAEAKVAKMQYPDITIRDKRELLKYNAGDEFTANVTFRVVKKTDAVKSSREWDDGKPSVELELVSIEPEGSNEMAADSKEEGAEEAMDDFFLKRNAANSGGMGEDEDEDA